MGLPYTEQNFFSSTSSYYHRLVFFLNKILRTEDNRYFWIID